MKRIVFISSVIVGIVSIAIRIIHLAIVSLVISTAMLRILRVYRAAVAVISIGTGITTQK